MQHVGISHSVLIGVVSSALLEGKRNERREDMELTVFVSGICTYMVLTLSCLQFSKAVISL